MDEIERGKKIKNKVKFIDSLRDLKMDKFRAKMGKFRSKMDKIRAKIGKFWTKMCKFRGKMGTFRAK